MGKRNVKKYGGFNCIDPGTFYITTTYRGNKAYHKPEISRNINKRLEDLDDFCCLHEKCHHIDKAKEELLKRFREKFVFDEKYGDFTGNFKDMIDIMSDVSDMYEYGN